MTDNILERLRSAYSFGDDRMDLLLLETIDEIVRLEGRVERLSNALILAQNPGIDMDEVQRYRDGLNGVR